MTSNEKIYTEKECLICYNLNQEDTEILNSIAENIKIKMHLTGEISELISVPHFCIIADLSGLDKDTLIDFKSFLHKDLILKRIILINYLPETICDLNFHRENFYKDIDITKRT